MNVPDLSSWLKIEPYSLGANEKSQIMLATLRDLTCWHVSECEAYRKILTLQGINAEALFQVQNIPFIPVRLFKEFDLLSIEHQNIFKIMNSSGTTGQLTSKIYLDRETSAMQIKVLSRIMGELLGSKRLPMLIIDSPSILKDRKAFSARGAGILGFSLYGMDITYALDDSMNLDFQRIEEFINRHKGESIFIFGFTFMIWQYFLKPLKKMGKKLSIESGLLLHGGGWKKLQDQSVGADIFRKTAIDLIGINRVTNYYGMVEQTGSLFMECEAGHLHTPVFADVIIRNPKSFDVAGVGEEGIIQVLSILPLSYPGHSLITEDMGVLHGEDDCQCGRLGKHFSVLGRMAKAEIRGCSDTQEINA
jgi:phenylacetate-coenzyme A ligase PaaK-like adenylate-forming protein